MEALTEELQSIRAERDQLLSEKESSTEKLQSDVVAVSKERDQLQELLEDLRENKEKLLAELENNLQMVSFLFSYQTYS